MILSIITPERELFKDLPVKRVTVSTTEGEITILDNHTPLVTFLTPGEIIIEDGAGAKPLAVSGGFLEVADNRVKILADTAERVEELDVERAEVARRRAEELLKTKQRGDVEFAALSAKIEKELARIKVGKKYRHIKPPAP
jgi:F-type H+-transporting ATPase subunit epsilon